MNIMTTLNTVADLKTELLLTDAYPGAKYTVANRVKFKPKNEYESILKRSDMDRLSNKTEMALTFDDIHPNKVGIMFYNSINSITLPKLSTYEYVGILSDDIILVVYITMDELKEKFVMEGHPNLW